MSQRCKPFIKLKNDSNSETTYYSAFYEGFPEEFKHILNNKINETEELKKQSIQQLKDYMKTNNMKTLDDRLLLAILRFCKYNMKNSEVRVKRLLVIRRQAFKKLSEIDPEKTRNLIDSLALGILPYRDKNGSFIVYMLADNMDLERYKPHDFAVVLLALGFLLLEFPLSSVTGFSCFIDCLGLDHRYLFSIIKEFSSSLFLLSTLPLRISRFEIFNESSISRILLKIASPFCNKKMLGRFFFHGAQFHQLMKHYDRNIIPKEFGGNMGAISNEFFKQKLLNFIEDFKNENIS